MRKLTVMAAAALAAFASPAMAQDGDTDQGGAWVGGVAGLDVVSLEAGGISDRDTGLVFGLAAGYDVDTGNALFGVEVEVSDTTVGTGGVGDAGVDLYAGIRAGLEVDDNDVIYLKAGYSNVDVDLFNNLDGARVGVGYEKRLNGSLFGRLEYRYTTYNVSDTLGVDVNGNRNQIVLVIGGKF